MELALLKVWRMCQPLFPEHAAVTQLGSNSFQITWWQGDEASANEGFATPIVVRLAPPLLHELQSAPEPTAAQKVHALGGDLRSGLAGYDPWSGKAHTIVLR